jgi:hypothetical protein
MGTRAYTDIRNASSIINASLLSLSQRDMHIGQSSHLSNSLSMTHSNFRCYLLPLPLLLLSTPSVPFSVSQSQAAHIPESPSLEHAHRHNTKISRSTYVCTDIPMHSNRFLQHKIHLVLRGKSTSMILMHAPSKHGRYCRSQNKTALLGIFLKQI